MEISRNFILVTIVLSGIIGESARRYYNPGIKMIINKHQVRRIFMSSETTICIQLVDNTYYDCTGIEADLTDIMRSDQE